MDTSEEWNVAESESEEEDMEWAQVHYAKFNQDPWNHFAKK